MRKHRRSNQAGLVPMMSRWSITLCSIGILSGCASIFDADDGLPHTARNLSCAGDSSALAFPRRTETNGSLAQDDQYTMSRLCNDCSGRADH